MNDFAILFVGDRETDCFGYCRVLEKNAVNFEGRYLLASTVDQFLDAARECQVTGFAEEALVACAEPAVDECLGVCFGIVVVAVHHVFALDHDFANFTHLLQITSGFHVHDGDLHAGRLADGSGDSFAGGHRA